MANWTERKQLAIPKDYINQANVIAKAVDPDVGGAETFGEATHSPSGVSPATHSVAHTQLKQETYGLLAEGTPSDIADEVERRTDKEMPPEGEFPLTRQELEDAASKLEFEVGYKEVMESPEPI
jgi:hypothetical protein